MSVFSAAMAAGDVGIYAMFGSSATHTALDGTQTSCSVILEHSSESVAIGYAEASERRTLLRVRTSEIAAPAIGDTFLVSSTTYTVRGIVARDADNLEVTLEVN